MQAKLHTYTSTARRDCDHWLVDCDQHPSVQSRVTNLDGAVRDQRRLLAVMLDVPEEAIVVTVEPVVPDVVQQHVKRARELRDTMQWANRAAAHERRAAARVLARDLRLSLRDIGIILGVSAQRAHQLVHASGGGW